MSTKKHGKQDPKIIALMDPSEVKYVASRFKNPDTGKNISQQTVKDAARTCGSKGRGPVYAQLKKWKYILKPLTRRKKK